MQPERTEEKKAPWWVRLHGVGPVAGLVALCIFGTLQSTLDFVSAIKKNLVESWQHKFREEHDKDHERNGSPKQVRDCRQQN